MPFPCPAPSCRRAFDSSAGLYFHLKAEHPEGPGAYRTALRDARRQEHDGRQLDAEARAQRKLDHLYRMGCPCGRSFEWHQQQRRAVEAS